MAIKVTRSPSSSSTRFESLHVESYSKISALPVSVRKAMLEAEKSSIEQGPDWYDNLIKTVFTDDPGVRFYALFHDDCVLAVLPVRVVKNRIGKTIEALGNFYTSLYQPYISDLTSVDFLAFMLRSMVIENGNVTGFLFSPMDVAGHPYRIFSQAFPKAGFPKFSYHCFGNWYLNAGMTWQDYLKTRTGAMRSNIKRAKKRFLDDGGELEFIQEGPLLDAAIQDFQMVYKNSWKNEEPFPNFIPDLIRLLSTKNSLRLCIARLNGEPIGGQLWIVANEKASIFKVAYHEDFKRYSIGYLIGGMLTEHVLDVDKVKEIDFLIGDDPYKSTWMSDRRERWGIVAYNPKTLKGLCGLGQEVMWRLLKPLFLRLTKGQGKVDD